VPASTGPLQARITSQLVRCPRHSLRKRKPAGSGGRHVLPRSERRQNRRLVHARFLSMCHCLSALNQRSPVGDQLFEARGVYVPPRTLSSVSKTHTLHREPGRATSRSPDSIRHDTKRVKVCEPY
jgi:hypothetical protein